MAMDTPSIYGLYDALGNLRYVGKANSPDRRLRSHMRDAHRRNTPLYCWLRKHGVPELRVLEEGCADWVEAERRHISRARADGCDLLNVAEGGDQPFCPRETREANGRKTAATVHGDPLRKRLWRVKRELGDSLKRGYVRPETQRRMGELARRRPDLFPSWIAL